jgi:ribose 1,5-bisphosphokinase PhnN
MSKKQTQESSVPYTATVEGAVENVPLAEMTAQELKTLVQSAVREVLQEILADPDAGRELRPEFEARLQQAEAYVTSGGSLLSMEELVGQIEDANSV